MFWAILMMAGGQAASADPCAGSSTPDINACLGRQLAAAETVWHRYADAARRRIAGDVAEAPAGSMAAGTAVAFDRAETAWQAYRKAECDAVYADWSGGTIRGAMAISCSLELTKLHTHVVWQNWLTYEDSTPPTLPEPPLTDPG